VEAAIAYDAQGADELVFLDITASHEDRSIMLDVVRRTAEVLHSAHRRWRVRTVDDVRTLLRRRKASFTPRARSTADDSRAAERFGSQCIVVAIDARRTEPPTSSNRPPTSRSGQQARSTWTVYTHGGRRPTGRDAIE
jgi:cyclase